MQIEIRRSQTAATPTVKGRTMTGHAIVYNALFLDLGGFQERFLPGSVSDTIKSGQIELWAHHDRTKPLASQASGTLRLREDAIGLAYDADLPEDNTDADNLISLMNRDRPVIGGTSFGFRINGADGQRWKREGDQNVREVLRADLEHISPVVTPAYPSTTALLRSLHAADVADLAETYGVDLATLAKIFIATKRGFALTADETELSRNDERVIQ